MTESTFDAATAVKDLEYTFVKYRPNPDAEGLDDDERDRRKRLADLPWTGTVPEPDDDLIGALFDRALPNVGLERTRRIEAFQTEQRRTRLEWWHAQPDNAGKDAPADGFDVELPADMMQDENDRFAELLAELRGHGRRQVVDALTAFCQGQPPREVLTELPARVLASFLGWLTGQFRPER